MIYFLKVLLNFSWLNIEAFVVGHKRKPVSVSFNTEVLFAVKVSRKQKNSQNAFLVVPP